MADQKMAPAHITQGSADEYKVAADSASRSCSGLARRMADSSAWAVQSPLSPLALEASASTRPSAATMSAPNGRLPRWRARSAMAMARRRYRPSRSSSEASRGSETVAWSMCAPSGLGHARGQRRQQAAVEQRIGRHGCLQAEGLADLLGLAGQQLRVDVAQAVALRIGRGQVLRGDGPARQFQLFIQDGLALAHGGHGQCGLGQTFDEGTVAGAQESRSEEHTSELQSQSNLVCRLLLEKKK